MDFDRVIALLEAEGLRGYVTQHRPKPNEPALDVFAVRGGGPQEYLVWFELEAIPPVTPEVFAVLAAREWSERRGRGEWQT